MDEDARLMTQLILGSKDPRTGYLTNPKARNKLNYIEVNGEKLVCVAQGGECRYNSQYYTLGMGDVKSWTTPVIDENCPNECGYKRLVCDEHPEKECPSSVKYYPQYNKFRGQFEKYCREFSRLEKADEEK